MVTSESLKKITTPKQTLLGKEEEKFLAEQEKFVAQPPKPQPQQVQPAYDFGAISKLIDQYGTTFEETEKLVSAISGELYKFTTTLKQPQTYYFTSDEAGELGVTIPEGWSTKIITSPDMVDITQTLISPEGTEYKPSDIIVGAGGEWFTRQELQVSLMQYETAQEQEARLRELLGAVYPPTYGSAYQEVLLSEGVDLRSILSWLAEEENAVEQFLTDILEVGRTPDTEELIKLLFTNITEAQMAELFSPVTGGVFAGVQAHRDFTNVKTGEVISTEELWRRYPMGYEAELDEWVREPQSVKDFFSVLGKTLLEIPKQIAASVLQLIQGYGGASVTDRDWADRFIKDANEDLDKFTAEMSERYGESSLPIGLTDIIQLPRNIAYSLTSMGAGLAVGVPVAFIPVPGARVAAWAAGTAASGVAAYNMTTYQIMQEYLEAKNDESFQNTGKGITQEQEDKLKSDFESKAREYGLWEAIPEAISNLAFAKILTAPLTRVVGRSIAVRIIGKLVGLFGEELLTETITQKGQSAIEVEAGLREGNISWTEAFKEIAPQTFLLTIILSGLGQTGVSAVNRIKASLKTEIGVDHPLYKEINDNITEDIIPTSEKSLIAPLTTPATGEYAGWEQGVERPFGFDPDSTENEGRFRLLPPDAILSDTILRIKADMDGIFLVQGASKQTDQTVTQSIRFDRQIFDEEQARNWWESNKGKFQFSAEIPQAEAGMPEAGLQPSMLEEVPAKEVRPVPTAPVVQAKLDDYLKLQKYEAEVAPNRISEIKKLLSTKGRLPTGMGTRAQAEIELARLEAQQEIDAIENMRQLEQAIEQIRTELGNRSLPFHGGEKSMFPQYNTKQLQEMLNVYEEARTKITSEVSAAPPIKEEVTPDVVVREQLAELQKMSDIWARKLADRETVKASLAKFVRENLPMNIRGKFITAVARIRTDAQLQIQIAKVMEVAELNAQKVITAEIRKEIKGASAKIKGHILKGKFTPEVQRRLDVINHNLELDRDTAREKMVDNIAKYESGELSYEEMLKANEVLNFAGIGGMSSEELASTLEYIKILGTVGRSERQAKQEDAKKIIEATRTEISNILTGGKGLKTGIGAVPRGELAAETGWWDAFTNWQYGLDNIADKLSKLDPTSKPYQSAINLFVAQVHRATNRQIIGAKEAYNKFSGAVAETFKVKGVHDINQVLNGLEEEVNLGTFELTEEYKAKYPGAAAVTIKMTRDEMLAKYMQMQDSTLIDTFTTGMGWSQQVRDAVESNLTEQEKKLGDVIFQFYEDYYLSVNEVYQELFNVDMPHNPKYSPIRRDFESNIAEHILALQDASQYASVLNGSLKARQKNILSLKFNGATQILSRHIEQMEHFKAWALTIRDMRRVFGSTEIRQAIEQYHGRGVVRLLDKFINQMARDGVETAATNRAADTLRKNFTKSILAIKPAIGLKQVPSLFAYLSEMNVLDFVTGIASYWKSPVANFKFLYTNSEGFRARVSAGFERDVRAVMEKHGKAAISGRGKFTDWFLLQIRAGDVFAVTQGMWAKYKVGLKQGLTQDQAIAAAEDTTNRTQPSFGIDTLSAIQNGGSWFKLMTMFQNQPNKYFRIIGDNLRNFQYGRGSRAKASSTILLAWVILPMMFQFIADAFQWKPERQARAAILGPLNFILIGGQMVQTMWGWLSGEPFDYRISPVLSTVDEVQKAFFKAKNMVENGLDPFKDISFDDVADLVEYLAKATGQLLGLPTPYLVQVEKGLREKLTEGKDIDIKDFLFSQWALKPPAKNDEQRVEDAGLKLGEVKEGQEDEPLTEKALHVYDTADWFNEIGDIYDKVFPQDVLDNPQSSKESKAWAESEIARSNADILPNIPLYEINTENDGDTIINYYQQWKARERITSLAELKEFDKLYPKAYLGNVTRQQYSLLVDYLNAEDKATFLENHPGLKIDPRDEWLKEPANAREAALLALRGQAKLLSFEAYTEFNRLIKELDIPLDAIPEQTLPPEGSVDKYFEYKELKANSWEAQLLLAQDNDLRVFLGRDPVEMPISLLESLVANRVSFDLHVAYGDRTSDQYIADAKERAEARQNMLYSTLPGAEAGVLTDFGKAYYTKAANSAGYSESNWDNFVEYSRLPTWGTWRDRFLLNTPEFYAEYTSKDIGGHALVDETKVKPLIRDELYGQWYNEFKAWDDTAGMPPDAVQSMRDGLDDTFRDDTTFEQIRYRIEAYDLFFPENLIDTYVEWYTNIKLHRPEGYEGDWYEDDWFLMAHKEFYNTLLTMEIWKEERDFTNVPSREIFSLYQQYLRIATSAKRLAFRRDHPELDSWLHTAKGYKPIADRYISQKETWWDVMAQEAADVQHFLDLMNQQMNSNM